MRTCLVRIGVHLLFDVRGDILDDHRRLLFRLVRFADRFQFLQNAVKVRCALTVDILRLLLRQCSDVVRVVDGRIGDVIEHGGREGIERFSEVFEEILRV